MFSTEPLDWPPSPPGVGGGVAEHDPCRTLSRPASVRRRSTCLAVRDRHREHLPRASPRVNGVSTFSTRSWWTGSGVLQTLVAHQTPGSSPPRTGSGSRCRTEHVAAVGDEVAQRSTTGDCRDGARAQVVPVRKAAGKKPRSRVGELRSRCQTTSRAADHSRTRSGKSHRSRCPETPRRRIS